MLQDSVTLSFNEYTSLKDNVTESWSIYFNSLEMKAHIKTATTVVKKGLSKQNM